MRFLPLALLCACSGFPHVPPEPRSPTEASLASVSLETDCWEAGDSAVHEALTGTGVILSRHFVLTAEHVVRCPYLVRTTATLQNGDHDILAVQFDDVMFGSGKDLAKLISMTQIGLEIDVPPPSLVIGELEGSVCAITPHGEVCGQVTNSNPDVIEFSGVTRLGDSGAGVYDTAGRLVGVVTAGSPDSTLVTRVDVSWLVGT